MLMDMEPLDLKWANLLRVDPKWIQDYLIAHHPSIQKKVAIRAYSLNFSGNEENLQGIVRFLSDSIEHFVFDDSEIEGYKKRGQALGNLREITLEQ
jgi:hypothetical protein